MTRERAADGAPARARPAPPASADSLARVRRHSPGRPPVRAPDAVLLDFDGLLADTEGIHSDTWRAALAEFGVRVSEEEYADHWIRAGRGIADFVAERGLPLAWQDLFARKRDLYFAAIARDLRAMPGAHDLLAHLGDGTRLALVTSGRRALVDAALERLGMHGRFEVTVSFECVARPKPHPEPFLVAASRLGVDPRRCVALDDAEKGVVSAAEAGVPVVAVPNEHTRGHDFSRASAVVPSLDHVRMPLLERLVRDGTGPR